MLRIREASAGDLDWANRCYAAVDFVASSTDDFLAIADVDGARAGVGRIVAIDAASGELGGMYVDPAFRGQAVARALVEFLVAHAPQARLFCLPFAKLEGFYASCGFVPADADADVPAAIARKLAWCAGQYAEPVRLLVLARDPAGGNDASARDVSAAAPSQPAARADARPGVTMELGNFSVSLAVKDLAASRAFYEKLGFAVWGGDAAQGWLILKNGSTVIGLFQGMFEGNLLTFNPGWDAEARRLPEFTDVRELQRRLKAQGVALLSEADERTQGPASFTLQDPDGNTILVDQHV